MRNSPRAWLRRTSGGQAPVRSRYQLPPIYFGPLGDLTFTASADHASVVNYEARLYTYGTTNLVDSYNLGKPTPDGGNQILVHLYTWFNSHAAGDYDVKVASIGSTGSPGNESSTGDPFTVPIVSSG